MPSVQKALAVYSGGRWVAAAGGGGAVDLSGMVTKPEFVDAIQDLNAQLAARYTKDEVDDLFAALPPQVPAAIELHDEAAPDFGPGLTPAGAVAAVSPYEDGLHWFTTSSVLLLVGRKPLPNGEEVKIQSFSPVATAVGRLSSFAPPPGSVGTPTSWFVRQEGSVFFRLEAALPDDQFMPVGRGDVLESVTQQQLTEAIANVQAGTLTQEQVQAIVEAVVANGFDLSNYYNKAEVDAIAKAATDQAAIWDQNLRDQTFAELELVLTGIGNSLALKGDKAVLDAAVADIAALTSQQQTFLTQSDIDQTNQLLQALGTATQDCITGLELKADKTTVSSLGTTLMDAIMEVKGSSYTTEQTDTLLAGKADKSTTYTKTEVDDAIASVATGGTVDLAGYAKLNDIGQDITANLMKAQAFTFTKANTTLGFTRFPEYPNGKLGIEIGGPGGELQFVAYVSDLSTYAKQQDNTQNLLAKTIVAQAVGFGDSSLPPAALSYTDTGEGFGPRLVFTIGLVNDYVALRSDFEPIQARVRAIEDRAAAPTTFDPNLYWRRDISDTRYMLKADGLSKADFDNQMALFLYSRSQIDAKLAAINPVGAASINDPALAEFKQSLVEEVRKIVAGGNSVPPDVPWTPLTRVAGAGTMEARLLNGVIYLRGDVTITITVTGSMTTIARLPATFPKPAMETNSITYAIQTGSTYRRGIVRMATDGSISVVADGTMTAISLWGASAPTF